MHQTKKVTRDSRNITRRFSVDNPSASIANGCITKARYATRNKAVYFASCFSKHRAQPPKTPYRCRHCRGWHLTSKGVEVG